jgi:Lipocalin-like domain
MNQTLTKAILLALAFAVVPSIVQAGNEEIWGTYKIISATVHWLDNDKTEDAYGKHPNGYITYGKDGRMMVLVAFDGRPKLSKPETATIEQRDQLYGTMFAYAGTYTYTGTSIEHHIDVSWNEAWTGNTVIRDITRQGNRLTYVTRPQTSPRNGRLEVVTLVWEKIQ